MRSLVDQAAPGITHRDGIEVTRHQPNARCGGKFGERVAVDAVDPRGAEIDRHRSTQESGVHTTPEPISGLHDEDLMTEVGQLPGGGEARGAGPDDEDPTRGPLRRAVDPRRGGPTLEECAVHRGRILARRRLTGEEEPTLDVGAQIVAVGWGGARSQVAVGTPGERIGRPPGDEGVRRPGNRCRGRRRRRGRCRGRLVVAGDDDQRRAGQRQELSPVHPSRSDGAAAVSASPKRCCSRLRSALFTR